MKAYEILTKQILDKVDSGTLPWNKTRQGGLPRNYENNKLYSGINKLILLFDDYEDKRYLTLKQINRLGGKLKKGSVGTKVIFWKYQDKEKVSEYCEQSEVVEIPIIRYYTIFNIEQITGIDIVQVRKQSNTNRYNKAKSVIKKYVNKPNIITGLVPCYNPSEDIIKIPDKNNFISLDDYYSTLFHELIHSTGNKNRLNRFGDKVVYYGNKEYSQEELIAELGALFLCSETGIIKKTFNNSVAYISGWYKFLNKNKKEIIYASIYADKSINYILNNKDYIPNDILKPLHY